MRLTNSAAFAWAPLRKLIEAAWNALNDGQPTAPVIGELSKCCAAPETGIFVGLDGGEPKALLVVFLPQNSLYPLPQVASFYCKGADSKLRSAILNSGVDFVRSAGYNKVWIINRTGKSDEVHAKLFKRVATGKPIGSIMEYELN